MMLRSIFAIGPNHLLKMMSLLVPHHEAYDEIAPCGVYTRAFSNAGDLILVDVDRAPVFPASCTEGEVPCGSKAK